MRGQFNSNREVDVMRIAMVPTLMLILSSGLACNEPVPSTRLYQRQRLPGVAFEAAFDAAAYAVGERFRISSRDAQGGVIRGEDSRASLPPDGSRPIGDVIGTPRRARRLAEVRVRTLDEDSEVYCRVLTLPISMARPNSTMPMQVEMPRWTGTASRITQGRQRGSQTSAQ